MRSAGTPVVAATDSGVQSRARAASSSTPVMSSAIAPRSTSASAKSTWTTAMSSAASVPGVIGIHSSAWSTVPVRRGSTTITRPPRSRILSSSPSTSGHASSEPCDACGLAPITTTKSVRGTSGTGIVHIDPYSSWLVTFFGHWSTVPAE